MKPVDQHKMDALPGRRLKKGETFLFACHDKVSCFNRCCRNLNLFLYPYDVLRLKNGLGISSDRFLDQYVDVVLRENSFFPDVLLKMADNAEKTCPYLTESGCSVYPDRPDTCRTFPVEQGALYKGGAKKPVIVSFFRPPEFCQGRFESQEWTTDTWAKDQEAETYNKMTAQWSGVKHLFQTNPFGADGPGGAKGKMAFMAAYNIDRFHEFVFNSSFLTRYKVKPVVLKKIQRSETDLLKFGFKWIKFFLWGIKTKDIRLKQ